MSFYSHLDECPDCKGAGWKCTACGGTGKASTREADMNIKLTPKAEREMEEVWKLRREALHLLRLVIAEWDSDPQSVQCFDLRIVKRAKEVSERIRKLDPLDDI